MNNSCFSTLWIGLLLLILPVLSIHSQNTNQVITSTNIEFQKANKVQEAQKSYEKDENPIKSNRFLISFDGNFQHFQYSYKQSVQKERIATTFGYFLNKKMLLGLNIQFSQEEDFLNFSDSIGFGGRTNRTYKRKFQPFIRKYFYNTNKFTFFSELSLNVASEEFFQSRNYYDDSTNNDNLSTSFEYATFGAHLGLGLEYDLNEHWVIFTFLEAIQYKRELNQEESSSDNIVLEDAINMSGFRDLRLGFGYYF